MIVEYKKENESEVIMWLHTNVGRCGEEWGWVAIDDPAGFSFTDYAIALNDERQAVSFLLRWGGK